MSTIAPTRTASTQVQPSSLSKNNDMLQRKCVFGSPKTELGETSKKNQSHTLQRKLAIGASNDPLEMEADRVAEQVLTKPTHIGVSNASPRIQRFGGQSSGNAETAPPSVNRTLAGPGRPLEPALRHDMEQRFGYDFSRVRVHTDAAAEQSARDVNANAYTVGHNIVFDAGQFGPNTNEGRRLIAHELTHVVQQSGANESRSARASKNHRAASETTITHTVNHSVVARQPTHEKSSSRAVGGTAVARLTAIVDHSSERAHELNTAASSAGDLLKNASSHLVEVADNYQAGRAAFDETLEKAKAEQEQRERIKGLIEFVLLGTVLELIAPEVLLFEVLKPSIEAYKGWLKPVAKSLHDAKVTGIAQAVEVFASKVRDVGVEKFLDAIHDQGAGTTPPPQQDLVSFALHELDRLVQAKPDKALDLNQEQNDLALEAAKLAGKLSGAESGQTVAELEQVDSRSAIYCELALATFKRFDALAEEILRLNAKSSDIIERELWTAWIANLDNDQARVLDTDVMAEKLHQMGYDKGRDLPFGPDGPYVPNFGYVAIASSHPSSREQDDVVYEAQNRWLDAHGIDRHSNDKATASRFHGEWQLALISEEALNRVGTVTSIAPRGPSTNLGSSEPFDSRGPFVAIGSHRIPIRRVYWFHPADGDLVRIVDLHVKDFIARGGTYAGWDESMFEADVETIHKQGQSVVSTQRPPP